jgi:hypothetical protein
MGKNRFMRLTFQLAVLLAFLTGFPATADSTRDIDLAREQGNHLTIKLLTIGPGDPVYLWYGHTALIVEDALRDSETLYDYGIFDFAQDNFYRNFAMGRLIYGVAASPAWFRIQLAEREKRSVSIAVLDLPPESRFKLSEFLRENVQPGNNTYLYHHYYDNCSTRIRDVIDMAVDGQFKLWAEGIDGSMSYREHIRRFSGSHFFMDWVLNFLQSGVIDKPIRRWDDMFLPSELEKALLDFSFTDSDGKKRAIVSSYAVLNPAAERTDPPLQPSAHWPWAAGLSVTAGGIGLFLYFRYTRAGKKGWRIAYGLYSGLSGLFLSILGLVLLFMMLFTDHDVTFWNENILLASPLQGWAGLLGIRIALGKGRNTRLQRILFSIQGLTGTGLIFAKLLFPHFFHQQNWLTIMLIVPAALIMGIPRRGYKLRN